MEIKAYLGIITPYPGIDAAGIVSDFLEVDRYQKGDEVIVTGYDLGMNTSGGFFSNSSEYLKNG